MVQYHYAWQFRKGFLICELSYWKTKEMSMKNGHAVQQNY